MRECLFLRTTAGGTASNPRVVDFETARPELPGAVREAFRIADLPGYLLLDLQPERTISSLG